MELIQIGEDALKVTLTKEDMEHYAIEFEQLDYENTQTRRALHSILEEAKRTIGFEATRDKLYIQAFKDKHGGCELFVQRVESKVKDCTQPSLFRFSKMESLLKACARLQNCGFIGESNAFMGDDGKWYLTLSKRTGTDPRLFLTELGTALPHSEAFLNEHAKMLCTNAVFALAALQ